VWRERKTPHQKYPKMYCLRDRQNNHRNPCAKIACGFTLLELLVVIVIIGLLAAYVGPKYFAQLGRSEVTRARAQIEAFEKALDAFRLDVGRYPLAEEGLHALVVQPAQLARWNGPYLQKDVPPDPWGHTYVYRVGGAKSDYQIVSLGKDGQAGGDGSDADISN
jgi:general secretion pathway protein G